VTARRLRTAQTDELEPERFDELTELCEAAFAEPFAPVWERVGPGLHVTAEVSGRIVAHAMIVDRLVYVGTQDAAEAIDAGYVENVATLPAEQGRGHAAAVMGEIGRILAEQYSLGALATGENAFYAKAGWETWRGPTWVRTPDGERVRSADQDGHVMIRRTPRSPASLDLDLPIAIDWRPEESW
jgi:aminoglycoside 2'-N-acetyltransferase I